MYSLFFMTVCDIDFGGSNDGFNTYLLGTYVYQDVDTNGVPYFKHQSENAYMWLQSSHDQWLIGSTVGVWGAWWCSKYGSSVSSSPISVAEWRTYDSSSSSWVDQSDVSASLACQGW